MTISDLRDRPDFAKAVADRVWRAFWKDKGHPFSLLTGLVQENLGAGPIPTALVAHEGSRFVGTVSIIACDEETRPHYAPWVAALWVEPEDRRRGIGAGLVERAAEFAFKAGADKVYLLSGPHRCAYYEGIGWSVLEVMDDGMVILTKQARTE
jgi:GNAT superfamily N-acetyltransferase